MPNQVSKESSLIEPLKSYQHELELAEMSLTNMRLSLTCELELDDAWLGDMSMHYNLGWKTGFPLMCCSGSGLWVYIFRKTAV